MVLLISFSFINQLQYLNSNTPSDDSSIPYNKPNHINIDRCMPHSLLWRWYPIEYLVDKYYFLPLNLIYPSSSTHNTYTDSITSASMLLNNTLNDLINFIAISISVYFHGRPPVCRKREHEM